MLEPGCGLVEEKDTSRTPGTQVMHMVAVGHALRGIGSNYPSSHRIKAGFRRAADLSTTPGMTPASLSRGLVLIAYLQGTSRLDIRICSAQVRQ
jgi:hypothetical protein